MTDLNFYLYSPMNQRSVSAMRKLKTDLPQDISFDKKIARAIQQKKTIISKMTGPKCQTHRLPSYRVAQSNHSQHNTTFQQKTKQTKAITLSQQMIKQCIQTNRLLDNICMYHPHKKAAFQDKENKNNVFCHECAIKMVKNNVKVVTLSEQTVMLKHLVHNQLQEIDEEQKKANTLLHNYYESLRNIIEQCYSNYLEQRSNNPQFILFKQFNNTKGIQHLVEHLGKIQQIKFKLTKDQNKQNLMSERNKQRLSTATYNLKEDQSVDAKSIINHSVQQPHSSYPSGTRSRQNSYYAKGEKYQKRKILNLR